MNIKDRGAVLRNIYILFCLLAYKSSLYFSKGLVGEQRLIQVFQAREFKEFVKQDEESAENYYNSNATQRLTVEDATIARTGTAQGENKTKENKTNLSILD